MKQLEKRQYSERVIHEIPQPTPLAFTMIAASIKANCMECHQKVTSLWREISRTADIVYDSVSSVFRFFVNHFLRYLVMLLTLVLLISIAHRAICEIPLVRYFHPQCTSVWAPKPVLKDPRQDHILRELEEPLRRNTESLNQLQLNEYLEDLPVALFHSSIWMTRLSYKFEHTPLEIPSKEDITEMLREYATKADKMGETVSQLWAEIPLIVQSILFERRTLVEKLQKSHSRAEENSTLTSFLDIPGLIVSLAGKSLLGRPFLTPYQTRKVEEEKVRIRLLRRFFPILGSLLGRLQDGIDVALKDFRELRSIVLAVLSQLQSNISEVSECRDLITEAQAHPLHRLRSLFRRNEKEGKDLRAREAQLELLTTTSGALTVTVRELVEMTHVVRILQNDMTSMRSMLWLYASEVEEGKISEGDLLETVKVGVEELTRGRVRYKERDEQKDKERRENRKTEIAELLMEYRDLMAEYARLRK